MIYLNYAKAMANGYILNFFADSEKDLEEVSNGKHFITKNGTDYGVPQPSSTVVITMPNKTKKTYMMDNSGEWVEDPGISSFFNPMPEVRCGLLQLDTGWCIKNEISISMTWDENLGLAVSDPYFEPESHDIVTWGGAYLDKPFIIPKVGELYLFVLPDVNPGYSILFPDSSSDTSRIMDAYICKVLKYDSDDGRNDQIIFVNYDSLNTVEEIVRITNSRNDGIPTFDYSTTKFILPLGINYQSPEPCALFTTGFSFFVKNKNCHNAMMQAVRIK